LQNSFPLIRRVDIEVKISREIWDVSGAAKFMLLDFPGLGAANSGARDTFLSLRELAEVQTILVLLNGKSTDQTPTISAPIVRHRTCMKPCGVKVPGINTLVHIGVSLDRVV